MSTPRSPGRRYHLKRVLGEGAFGRVYLAEQESEGGFRRLVALKVLNQQVAKRREAGRRMRDEARVLGQLQHRNIVAVLDLVQLDSNWAIVMDHVPGVDLEVLVGESGSVPPAAAFAVGVGVARALAAAHAAEDADGRPMKVVHRDIKPSNVRLTKDAEVKVLDFGVARFSLDSREVETRGVGMIGTERYMAPERILGQNDSPAGDVYALGATIFELLVGEPLGRTPALPAKHREMLDEALERIAIHAPEQVPPAWADAVAALEQSLAVDPADRPSASELAEAWAASVASLPGESLNAYAARRVPELELTQPGEPVSGVLSEGSRDEATVLRPDSLGIPVATTGASTHGGRPVWAFAAVGFALITGGLGVLAFVVASLIGVGAIDLSPSVPEPVAVTPAALPEPAPEPVAPVEVVAPDPVAVAPAPVAPVPLKRPRPAPAPRGPTVDRALFTLENASGIWVTCGEVKARGTASARIGAFPGGACEVRANYLGVDYTADVVVEAARTVRCEIRDEEGMSCS